MEGGGRIDQNLPGYPVLLSTVRKARCPASRPHRVLRGLGLFNVLVSLVRKQGQ